MICLKLSGINILSTIAILLLIKVKETHEYRILGVFSHPVKSNTMFTHAVMSAMAERGHQVTVYSRFSPPNQVPNLRHFEVNSSVIEEPLAKFVYQDVVNNLTSRNAYCDILNKFAVTKCNTFLTSYRIKDLLQSNETFDLVVTLGEFGEECLLSFGAVFNAPTVVILPSGTWSTVNYRAGNELSIAHIPDYFSYAFSDRMSFSERALNFGSTIRRLFSNYLHLAVIDEVIRQHFDGFNIPPVSQMLNDVSMTFVNSHVALGYPQPLTPNIVPIGGITISASQQTLPKNIQKIMDDAAEGVVYFSLGTIVPSDTMPDELIKAYINVFRNLTQIVIWKMSFEVPYDLPENIHVYSWLPQNAVLAHPNCQLFITHGGLHSQFETFSSGVPVVGIAFFTDQPYNIRLYEELGVGVGLDLHNLTGDTISSAVTEVLGNARYKVNARKVSQIFKDVPLSPADTVGYWMEYVIRHRGAAHLRPAATQLYWYQRTLLDVIAVTLIVAILLVSVMFWIIRTAGSIVYSIVKSFNKSVKYKQS